MAETMTIATCKTCRGIIEKRKLGWGHRALMTFQHHYAVALRGSERQEEKR